MNTLFCTWKCAWESISKETYPKGTDLGSALSPPPQKYFPGSMCKRVFLPQNSSLCIFHPLASNNGSLSVAIIKVAEAARDRPSHYGKGLCMGSAQQLRSLSHLLPWSSRWFCAHEHLEGPHVSVHAATGVQELVHPIRGLHVLPSPLAWRCTFRLSCAAHAKKIRRRNREFLLFLQYWKLFVWLAFHFLLSVRHSLPMEILKPPPLIVVLLTIGKCKRVLSQ